MVESSNACYCSPSCIVLKTLDDPVYGNFAMDRLLPTPVHSNISRIKNSEDIESDFDQNFVQEESKLISTAQEKNSRQVGENRNIRIPVYGKRSNWVPRSKEDFGEGGAYPEIHVAQYPGDFEKNKSQSSNALVKTFDNEGNVKYDSILRGNDQSGAKVIHATPHSMTGKYVNLDSIQQETEEEVIQTTAETSNALERLLNRKISTTIKAKIPESKPQEKSEYIRYTPAFGIPDSKSGVRQRIVKMVDAQIDPILPNAYNVNRKVPRGPPSPPAPVLHSPPRKISTKEAQDWKVPPCISNWKNPRGYTIPLHMRVAADGRNLENISINENFAKMSESLYLAESNARKAVEYRAT
ncbi:MAG: SNW domain-containing protein 1, partial [Marteilia pararefringens]